MWVCIVIQPLIMWEHTILLQLIPCLPHSSHKMDSTHLMGSFQKCHLKMCFIQFVALLPSATFKSFSEYDTVDFLIRLVGCIETTIFQSSQTLVSPFHSCEMSGYYYLRFMWYYGTVIYPQSTDQFGCLMWNDRYVISQNSF